MIPNTSYPDHMSIFQGSTKEGILFVLWRPMQVATAYAHRAAAFPTIADFSSPHGLDFVTTDGLGAAIAEFRPLGAGPGDEPSSPLRPAASSAVQVVEPQGDWRAFSVIAVDLTNAGPSELSLVLRILDATTTGRTRTGSTCRSSSRHGRERRCGSRCRRSRRRRRRARMDMARIANVMLFGRPPPTPGALVRVAIWLE